MELNFLNRLEAAIFKHANPGHEPISGKLIVNVFFGGGIVCFIVFILQMAGVEKTTENIVTPILLLCLLGYVAYSVIPTLKKFPGWGGKVGYCAYILAFSLLAFYLAMLTLVVAIAAIILWIVLKVCFPSDKGSGYTVHTSDGRILKAKKTGRGVCGETYIKDEDGNEHVIP